MPSSTHTTKHTSSTQAASTSLPKVIHTLPRNGPSLGVIIIIVIISLALGALFIFLAVRVVRRRLNRQGPAPLPPVQPIWHHRERELAQFEERKFNSSPVPSYGNGSNGGGSQRNSTWYNGHQLVAPAHLTSGNNSDSSLIPNKEGGDTGLASRQPSDISLGPEMKLADVEMGLHRPTPAFHTDRPSSSGSNGSTDRDSAFSASPFMNQPDTPTSADSNLSTQPLAGTAQPYATPRQPRNRPRPNSTISTASRTSRKSMGASTIRGAPHGPHSSVQIVLPAPLAAGLSPYGQNDHANPFGKHAERMSVADGWTGVGLTNTRSDSNLKDKARKKQGELEKKNSWGGGLTMQMQHDLMPLPRESTSTLHTYSEQSHSASSSNVRSPSPGLPALPNSHSQPSTPRASSPLQHQNAPAVQAQSQAFRSLSPTSPPTSPRNSRIGSSAPPSAFRDASMTPPPAVPRIPSIYNTFSTGGTDLDLSPDRGRSPKPESTPHSRAGSRDGRSYARPSSAGSGFFATQLDMALTNPKRNRSSSRTRRVSTGVAAAAAAPNPVTKDEIDLTPQ